MAGLIGETARNAAFITLKVAPRLSRWMQTQMSAEEDHDISIRQLTALQFIGDTETTLGDVARSLNVTPAVVTGLIDRLERLGLVERMADAQDRRKVLVRVREDRIAPIGALFAPMEKSMQGLLAGYSRDELRTLLDFAERAGEFMLARVAELNDGK